MNQKVKIRKMFPGGNTSLGFYSYYDYIMGRDANRIFILKGGPGVGKSTFMKKIAEEMANRGYDMEFHHCSSDNESLDGLCIPALKVAIVDGTAPHIVDPKNPGIVDEIIHLGAYWDEGKIEAHREQSLLYSKRAGRRFGIAYSLLREARIAYDEWAGYVAESMDRGGLNRIAAELEEKILAAASVDYTRAPAARHLFGSAITPNGPINHTDSLLDEDMRIYAIKGDPGSDVHDIIGRIAERTSFLGLYTEQFHCPFIPERVDTLIIPGIKTALVNVSQPMHMDISRIQGFNVVERIDLMDLADNGILQQYLPEIRDASERYYALIEKAVAQIRKAKEAHWALEDLYIPVMDFHAVDQKRQEVLERILRFTSKA